jgi:ABC-type uncharacterized transport system fused permease/ATPase subunit
MSAIINFERPLLLEQIYILIGVAVVIMINQLIGGYTGEMMALGWRRRVTRHLQAEYFLPRMVYNLNNLDRRIDNTDQRMSTSVQAFTYQFTAYIFGNYSNGTSILSMLLGVATSMITISTFGWIPPVVCAVYSLAVSLILRPHLKAVAKLTFTQNKYEGKAYEQRSFI